MGTPRWPRVSFIGPGLVDWLVASVFGFLAYCTFSDELVRSEPRRRGSETCFGRNGRAHGGPHSSIAAQGQAPGPGLLPCCGVSVDTVIAATVKKLTEHGVQITDPNDLVVRSFKEYLACMAIRNKKRQDRASETQKMLNKMKSIF